MVGRLVSHRRFGRGRVLRTRHRGFESLVEFADGRKRWVRVDELSDVPPLMLPARVSASPREPDDESFRHRRMIEAFRLGVVPYDLVDEFTFGRDSETRVLRDWLGDGQHQVCFLVGAYGVGKSHLVQYVRGRALREGFAVAAVDMDPSETPFHKPKRVYASLIQSFRYPRHGEQQPGGFREFLREVLSRGGLLDHEYFQHLARSADECLWEWIEARESTPRPVADVNYRQLPSLYDFTTAANIYCYLLSALGWAALQVMDLKGLLLLIDEAEAATQVGYGYQSKGLNFLQALMRTAANDPKMAGPPLRSGFDYCSMGYASEIPFLYRDPSGLKVVCAFTPVWLLDYLSKSATPLRLDLEPLGEQALKGLFEEICLIYDSAYGFLEKDPIVDLIYRRVKDRGGRTRMFVKAAVEALDLMRFGQRRPVAEVLA